MRAARVAVVMMLAAGAVVGCAPVSPEPSASTSTSTSTTPTLEPTPVVRVIAGGERPPAIVANCEDVIPLDELSAIVGEPIVAVEGDDAAGGDNLGATLCSWNTGGGDPREHAGAFWVAPRNEVGSGPIEDHEPKGGVSCTYGTCTAFAVGPAFLVISEVSAASTADENVDEREAEAGSAAKSVAAAVLSRIDTTPVTWVRDRSLWLPALDCDLIAEGLGPLFEGDVDVTDWLYEGPPRPLSLVVQDAQNATTCRVSPRGIEYPQITVYSVPGAAWQVRDEALEQEATEADLGVPGVTAYVFDGGQGTYLSDGVNAVLLRIDSVDASTMPDTDAARQIVAEMMAERFSK